MRERKFGHIITISSVNGPKGQFVQVNYSASKACDLGMTKSLVHEGTLVGISENAICPGYIDTYMVMAIRQKAIDATIVQIPTGRLGKPEKIAPCMVFLTSDDAGFVNGSTITANGGRFFV